MITKKNLFKNVLLAFCMISQVVSGVNSSKKPFEQTWQNAFQKDELTLGASQTSERRKMDCSAQTGKILLGGTIVAGLIATGIYLYSDPCRTKLPSPKTTLQTVRNELHTLQSSHPLISSADKLLKNNDTTDKEIMDEIEKLKQEIAKLQAVTGGKAPGNNSNGQTSGEGGQGDEEDEEEPGNNNTQSGGKTDTTTQLQPLVSSQIKEKEGEEEGQEESDEEDDEEGGEEPGNNNTQPGGKTDTIVQPQPPANNDVKEREKSGNKEKVVNIGRKEVDDKLETLQKLIDEEYAYYNRYEKGEKGLYSSDEADEAVVAERHSANVHKAKKSLETVNTSLTNNSADYPALLKAVEDAYDELNHWSSKNDKDEGDVHKVV